LSPLITEEWLVYVPIFVDFSQIDEFASWLREKMKSEAGEILEEIKKTQSQAWISPDFTTEVISYRLKINGFDSMIQMSFRLRTFCLEIWFWGTPENKQSPLDAFIYMKTAEDIIKTLTQKWKISTICNVINIKPFFESETKVKEWLCQHYDDLKFFPTRCHIRSTYTLSLSKLLERDEKLPFLIASIRDNTGIQRRVIILCKKKRNLKISDEPCSSKMVRWVFFSSLIQHVLNRISKLISQVADEISRVEQEVMMKSRKMPKNNDIQKLMEILQSTIDFQEKISVLEKDLNIAFDDLAGVKRNLMFLEATAGSKGTSNEKVKEEIICGNTYFISTESGTGYGIFRGISEEEARKQKEKCSLNYYCGLCDAGKEGPDLDREPPLKMGVMEETKHLIKCSIANIQQRKLEIERCMNRIRSLISSILSIIATRVNTALNVSISNTAIDQKEILIKLEKILEKAEEDRKAAENATRAVEILSLLFASFVIGEIASNFITLWLQQIGAPGFMYFVGFLVALGIAVIFFLPTYWGYLKRRWKKRKLTSTLDR